MDAPTLQDALDQAGSAVNLLWKPDAVPFAPEVLEPEYAGWREEQHAWTTAVTIADLSHHMWDTFIEGPQATDALQSISANNYENFAIGQAKQFIPVAPDGNLITDGILLRTGEQEYVLSGISTAQTWTRFHASELGFDVSFVTDPQTMFRGGDDPTLFRFQIQGPLANDLIEEVFGGPLPPTKFFHTTEVSLNGRRLRALRHGMAGQPGFEFIGRWEDAAAVKEAFVSAGDEYGLVEQGAMSYPTATLESGWIAPVHPAIYSDPDLRGYRESVSVYSYDGQKSLLGSFFSPHIEDYYCSPWEMNYGRSISFNHDFIGRDALRSTRDTAPRTKVTLVFDPAEVHRVVGEKPGYIHNQKRNRIETPAGDLVGTTFQDAWLDPVGTVLSLALIEKGYSEPGTRVEVVWGDHPGPGTPSDADLEFPRISATVAPAPYAKVARTTYRQD